MGNSEKPQYLRFGKRHVLVFWLFTGFMNVYILRVFVNTAIISMVYENNTIAEVGANQTANGTITPDEGICLFPETTNVGDNSTNSTKKEGEFHWDHVTRGLIKSSFYYGYMATQFFGGYLPMLIGGRLAFGAGIVGTALLTLLNPIAARVDPIFLIIIRGFEGAFQGVAFPCSHYLLGNWAPKQERSVLVTLPLTGANVGTVLAAPLTAIMCDYGFDGGWPTSFYVWGAFSLIWSIGWFYFVRDSPAVHPTISEEERKYIQENTQSRSKPIPFTQMPWGRILISPAIWAIAIAQTTYSWNYYTMLTEISTYMKDVLHISSGLNGLMASVPYVCLIVVQISAAFLADFLRAKGVPTRWVRIGSHCFGMFSSAAILICVRYAGCDVSIVIVMLCIAVSINGFGYAGYVVNHMDVAPQYAGILMGFTNSWAQIPGILSPVLTGAIVNERSTIDTWQTVFYISAGVTIGGAALFALMADGEVQSWARVVDETPNNNNNKKDNNASEGTGDGKTAAAAAVVSAVPLTTLLPIANQQIIAYPAKVDSNLAPPSYHQAVAINPAFVLCEDDAEYYF